MSTGYVFEEQIETDKIDKKVALAICSDLHLWKKSLRGFENIELLIKMIEDLEYDYLLIAGDLIHDTKYLKNEEFREEFIDIMKKLSNKKLTFIVPGEHDVITKDNIFSSWEEKDKNLLKETLKKVPNVIYLDGLRNFSLNQTFLRAMGYPSANINIIGADLPYTFYSKEGESNEAFLKYWNEMLEKRPNPTNDRQYNILMLHALRNYITLNKEQNKNLLPNIDLAIGGHYHNGTIPNRLLDVLTSNKGLISLQKELFPDNVKGLIEGNPTYYLSGFTNYNVENSISNTLLGGPCILYLELLPKQKTNTNDNKNKKVLKK